MQYRSQLISSLIVLAAIGCGSEGVSSGTDSLTVPAGGAAAELGLTEYELFNEADTIQVLVFDEQETARAELSFSEEDGASHTMVELRDEVGTFEILRWADEFTMSIDGAEIARAEDGVLVSAGDGIERLGAYEELLVAIEADPNFVNAMDSLRPDEQFAVVCAVEDEIEEGDDGGVGGMSGGGFDGPMEFSSDKCGYWGCVWKVIKAEAAIAVIAGAIAAAGTVCATACAATIGAGCVACAAAALGGGVLGLDTALSTICDACANDCIPGCEGYDCN